MKLVQTYSIYFLALVYICGSIGMIYNPSFFIPFTPYSLLLTCFVFIINQPFKQLNFLRAFLSIAIIGYAIEVIGVKTGLIFGIYHYGNSLGFKYLDVPIIISLNWSLIVCAATIFAHKVSSNYLVIPLIAAAIGTSIDFIMEQVVFKLDFWYFKSGIAQTHNYIAWFLIIFISALVFKKHLSQLNYTSSLFVLILQLVFFGIIYLFI